MLVVVCMAIRVHPEKTTGLYDRRYVAGLLVRKGTGMHGVEHYWDSRRNVW